MVFLETKKSINREVCVLFVNLRMVIATQVNQVSEVIPLLIRHRGIEPCSFGLLPSDMRSLA